MGELPTLAKIREAKAIFDTKITDKLKVSSPSESIVGHMIDLDEAIKAILDLYYALGGKKKRKVYCKISVDGRAISNAKQVAIALVPLNLRDQFKSQEVSSVFYIGLFHMSETKDTIEQTIGTLKQAIKDVQVKNYSKDNSNETTEVKLIYVSDMHNVGFTFDYDFCPYCIAQRVEQFNSEKRQEITGLLPFQPDDIIMCSLHVKQRLVENTIGYMASSCYSKDIILDNLRKLKDLGLDFFLL